MLKRPAVAVLGGGISGLAAALRAAGDGLDVLLLEGSAQLGGLGTYFDWNGAWVDRFYHCVMPSDAHLRGMIHEVGLTDAVYWKPTTMGFVHGGKHYAFNTPLDLLRFAPLRPHERLRLGATTLALRHLGDPAQLDDRTTADWLSSIFGRRIWENFWQPLFYAKFGDRAATLPALYIWQRLGREGNTSDRGYLRGGLKRLIDGVAAEIERRGGRIVTSATAVRLEPVDDIAGPLHLTYQQGESTHTAAVDWALSTLPMPALAQITHGTALEPWVSVPDLPYQAVVNALFFLDRPLGGHYWLPVVKSGTEFDGVVEITTLVDREPLGGAHLAYVMKYGDRNGELFSRSDADIEQGWTEQFLRIYAPLGLQRSDIRDVRVFRAPFVEPAYPLGYSRKKPDFSVGPSRLVLATSAQVYPHITSWNSAVRLCEQSLIHLYRRAGRAAPRPFALPQAA